MISKKCIFTPCIRIIHITFNFYLSITIGTYNYKINSNYTQSLKKMILTLPKKMRLTAQLIIILLLGFSYQSFAQISFSGKPLAHKTVFSQAHIEQMQKDVHLSETEKDLRYDLLTRETPPGQALQAGFSIPVNFTPGTDGDWVLLGDSLWVWRMQINVSRAHGIGMVLDNFELADHSELFVYDKNADFYLGSFTSRNNNPQQLLSVQAVPGESLILEYRESILPGNNERFAGSSFEISEIIYLVNGLIDTTDERNLGSSDWCMLSVNCSEGDDWQIQKRGVARLLMRQGNSWFWCSGSLINNTAHDGTPFLLTADHCASEASQADLDVWQFYFNFERPGCEEIGSPPNNVLYGASKIASGPLDGGSDFKLLLLHHAPPISWRPYYNGWDRMDNAAASGVGIHHPAGDAKMISTFEGSVISGGGSFNTGEVMADNSAWRFPFVATENGHSVTQGGSSGSPMFNQNGLIVGTLSGGSSSCSNQSAINVYGKMSFHWQSNLEHPMHQLAPHLDPINSNRFFINGYDPYIENHPAPGFVTARATSNFTESEVKWFKPGHAPNHPGWFSHTSEFVNHINHGPERVTVFDAAALGFSYPITISKVSHVFRETTSDAWESDQFSFRIYDESGYNLIYSSTSLTAESLVEVVYELDSALTFEDKFFVSVRPNHQSGHPSSVYGLTNYGNSFSYYGFAQEWEPAGNNTHQFVYLTSIYAEDSYDNRDIPESRLSNEGFASRWSDLPVKYNIYRNDEKIFEHDPSEHENFVFTDAIAGTDEAFLKYQVTAVYPPNLESERSTPAYLFFEEICEEAISEYPFFENFDNTDLPACWFRQGVSENSWELEDNYIIEDQTIVPVDGAHFMIVHPHSEENQDEWLLTPEFNISELEVPALRFYFTGSYRHAITEEDAQLNVFIRAGDNAFTKIWDTSENPLFRNSTSYTWLQTVLDLSDFSSGQNIQIGFQYAGKEGAIFAIDHVEIIEATELVFNLTMGMLPLNAGELYGKGAYISGQKVRVKAYPNTPYFFHFWAEGSNQLTYRPEYKFIMPENNYHINANFTEDNVTGIDPLDFGTSGMKVYPNPTKGILTIEFADNHNKLDIRIISSHGQEVYHARHAKIPGNSVINADISGYPGGVYLLMIKTDEGQMIERIHLIK